jgi:hypothetical protein
MKNETVGKLKSKKGGLFLLPAIFILIIGVISVSLIYIGKDKTSREDIIKQAASLDDSITKTNAANFTLYDSVDLLRARNSTTSFRETEQIYNIKQRADELFAFIQDLTLSCIKICEGENTVSIKGLEFETKSIQKLDNTAVPAKILIGKENSGRAYTLIELLSSYKEDLSAMPGFDPEVMRKFMSLIDADRVKVVSGKAGETKTSWAEFYFGGKTLGTTIVTMKKFQYSVRLSENLLIASLYNKMISEVKK